MHYWVDHRPASRGDQELGMKVNPPMARLHHRIRNNTPRSNSRRHSAEAVRTSSLGHIRDVRELGLSCSCPLEPLMLNASFLSFAVWLQKSEAFRKVFINRRKAGVETAGNEQAIYKLQFSYAPEVKVFLAVHPCRSEYRMVLTERPHEQRSLTLSVLVPYTSS